MTETTESHPPRWSLVTASYANYRPDDGVPVRTSVGAPQDFDHAATVDPLRPFGVFGRMDDHPVAERIAAYWARLDRRRGYLEGALDTLTAEYPDQPLVLLCFCRIGPGDDDGCHRRWAARWLLDRYGIEVAEITALGLWWSVPDDQQSTGPSQPSTGTKHPTHPGERPLASQPRPATTQTATSTDHPDGNR